jgi:hypothetical protein
VIETKIVFGYYSVTKNIETYIEDMEDKAKKKMKTNLCLVVMHKIAL